MTSSEWRWKNFKKEEFTCHHCGAYAMNPDFMDRLQSLREEYCRPMKISSGYRCPTHNAAVSSTGLTGVHTTGCAADILCHHRDAFDLVHLAIEYGFTGIGIKQHGDIEKRFIHLDTKRDKLGFCRIWSYP